MYGQCLKISYNKVSDKTEYAHKTVRVCVCMSVSPHLWQLKYFSIQIGTNGKSPDGTLQPLYNTVHYNTVLDIILFKDGSQKCIDYIEK